MKILAKRKVRRGFACVILRFWVFHKLKIRHQSFKKLGFGFSTFSESICLIRFWIFHILKTQNLSLPKPHRFWVLLLLGVLGFMLTHFICECEVVCRAPPPHKSSRSQQMSCFPLPPVAAKNLCWKKIVLSFGMRKSKPTHKKGGLIDSHPKWCWNTKLSCSTTLFFS